MSYPYNKIQELILESRTRSGITRAFHNLRRSMAKSAHKELGDIVAGHPPNKEREARAHDNTLRYYALHDAIPRSEKRKKERKDKKARFQ